MTLKYTLLAALVLLPLSLRAEEPVPEIDIRPVAHKRWGNSPKFVQSVLVSAAKELYRHFPKKALKPILVEPVGGPISLFDRGPGGEYRVRLDTDDNLWAQWVFQFAHEFGHILSDYGPVRHKNLWFEETICEVSSLFVLRQLSDTWAKDPSPDSWKRFSPNLKKYAKNRIEKTRLPEKMTLAEWFEKHAADVTRTGYDRDKNTTIAAQLLPLFEETPEHWAAIPYLAKAKKGHGETPQEFLKAWQTHCPEKHRAFVAAIANKLGIDLAKVELTPAKPNVLVILADDMGYADLGFTGNRQIKTPHLDALAASGVFCRQAYVSAPYCSPTRAGLLTGRYQNRFGHEFNPRPGMWTIPSAGLPTTESLFVQRLRAAGYRTGLVGKWHLGEANDQHPQARGFDEFFGFLGGESHYHGTKEKPLTVLRGKTAVEEPAYLTDALGREASAYIERNRNQPWFLYLAFNAVHVPQDTTERDLKRVPEMEDTRRRNYLAMLVAMDDAIGVVRAKLKQTGQEDNTLILFFNDNGGPVAPINPNVNGSINRPFRGGKRQLLEGGLRVPFLVSWPAQLAKGQTYDGVLSSLDIAPTALAAAGIAVKAEDRFDGVDLLPYLQGKKTGDPHASLAWRFGKQFAIREGDWKLSCWKNDTGEKFTTALYNLKNDVEETNDVAAAHPEVVRRLQDAWNAWNQPNPRPLFGDMIEMREVKEAPWAK